MRIRIIVLNIVMSQHKHILMQSLSFSQVNDVNGVPEPLLADYPLKFGGSRNDLDDNSTNYDKPPPSESPV